MPVAFVAVAVARKLRERFGNFSGDLVRRTCLAEELLRVKRGR